MPFSAGFSQTELAQIEPTPLMKHEARWLVQALEQAHFSKVSIELTTHYLVYLLTSKINNHSTVFCFNRN